MGAKKEAEESGPWRPVLERGSCLGVVSKIGKCLRWTVEAASLAVMSMGNDFHFVPQRFILGVIVDRLLTWKSQANRLKKKRVSLRVYLSFVLLSHRFFRQVNNLGMNSALVPVSLPNAISRAIILSCPHSERYMET